MFDRAVCSLAPILLCFFFNFTLPSHPSYVYTVFIIYQFSLFFYILISALSSVYSFVSGMYVDKSPLFLYMPLFFIYRGLLLGQGTEGSRLYEMVFLPNILPCCFLQANVLNTQPTKANLSIIEYCY